MRRMFEFKKEMCSLITVRMCARTAHTRKMFWVESQDDNEKDMRHALAIFDVEIYRLLV